MFEEDYNCSMSSGTGPCKPACTKLMAYIPNEIAPRSPDRSQLRSSPSDKLKLIGVGLIVNGSIGRKTKRIRHEAACKDGEHYKNHL